LRVARRYRILKTLGQGAGGAVHVVEDAFTPGEPIALKTLPEGDARADQALRREFELLAALRHPRLAVVFDFGRIPAGEPGGPATVYTREYLPGRTFRQAAKDGPLHEVADLAIGVCHALEPLHSSGWVHGDLKPENVIVSPEGRVRLIDFGLVRLEGEAEERALGTMIPYGAPPFKHESDREAIAKAYRPTTQWNHYEITCEGESLAVKLNGTLITTATEIKNLRGHVGIQAEHGHLEFRNIRVRNLK